MHDLEEIDQLREEAEDLCDDVDLQIAALGRVKVRFSHIWPADLDLEVLARQAARIKPKLAAAQNDPAELKGVISLLTTMKTRIESRYVHLLNAEQQDRFRYL